MRDAHVTMLGLIAGQGRLPFMVADGARAAGVRVVCAALAKQADPALARHVDQFYWVPLARPGRWISKLRRHGVTDTIMVGRVAKQKIYTPWRILQYLPDWRAFRIWYGRLRGKNKTNDNFLCALADELATGGIILEDSVQYCKEHLAREGVMTRCQPSRQVLEDIEFGWEIVKRMGDLDIGQAIAVKEREVIAVEAIEAFIEETAGADKNRTWPFPFDPTVSLESNRLRAAFRIANHKIAAAIADSHDLRGMATTASAVLLGPHGASVAHVGDSRVYVLRDGHLEQITNDHSWVEEQVRAGTLSPTAARQHPWRNVVTRALSGGEDPEVDLTEVSPSQGERYLLCSDGLFTVVPDSRIAQLLGQADVSLDAICRGLVQAANEAGGPDNITTLILQIDAS